MRVSISKQEMQKPKRPQFYLILHAENDKDKNDLEKIVFDSKNGLYYNPGNQLRGSDDRIISLTIRISNPTIS